MDEIARLIYNFYLSVAACKVSKQIHRWNNTLHVAKIIKQPRNSKGLDHGKREMISISPTLYVVTLLLVNQDSETQCKSFDEVTVWSLQLLEQAGFVNVRAEDRSQQFIQVLKRELKTTEAIREEFIKVWCRMGPYSSDFHLIP